jgi:hypothetical protein
MFLSDPSVSAIAESVSRHPREAGSGFLVLIGEEAAPDLAELVSALAVTGAPFLGGVFPALLEGEEVHSTGAVLIPLPLAHPLAVVRDLDRPRPPGQLLGGLVPEEPAEGCGTALVLVDGLAGAIQPLLNELFSRFGGALTFFGGGAGSLSFQPRPCLFCPQGVLENAALVAFVRRRCSLGVRHGWKPIMGPLVATRTRGPLVDELNWRPAFEVYQEALRRDSEVEVTPESFFLHSKRFPLGMEREGSEGVVRDPVAVTPEGALRCVGEVPENAVLSILKGDRQELIRAATEASRAALAGARGSVTQALVADCVSRALYHGDRFSEEIRAAEAELAPALAGTAPEGMLTLGEVASFADGSLAFLNKTIVVGLLHE